MGEFDGAERETLDWARYGTAIRELAQQVAETRCAVLYQKPTSLVDCDYVWKHTDRWINFPWSDQPPIVQYGGRLVLDA